MKSRVRLKDTNSWSHSPTHSMSKRKERAEERKRRRCWLQCWSNTSEGRKSIQACISLQCLFLLFDKSEAGKWGSETTTRETERDRRATKITGTTNQCCVSYLHLPTLPKPERSFLCPQGHSCHSWPRSTSCSWARHPLECLISKECYKRVTGCNSLSKLCITDFWDFVWFNLALTVSNSCCAAKH